MPRTMTEEEREAFLAEPRVGVVCVASDDERPHLLASGELRCVNRAVREARRARTGRRVTLASGDFGRPGHRAR